MIKYTVKVDDDGTREWHLNDQLHREDGPACEWANGSKWWWLNGQRHREDGPAIEYSDGTKSWYLNGQRLSEEEFLANRQIASAPCAGRTVEIDGVTYVLNPVTD